MGEFNPDDINRLTTVDVARNTLAAAQAAGDTKLATEMVGFLTAEEIAQRSVRFAPRQPRQIDHQRAQQLIDEIARDALGESTE